MPQDRASFGLAGPPGLARPAAIRGECIAVRCAAGHQAPLCTIDCDAARRFAEAPQPRRCPPPRVGTRRHDGRPARGRGGVVHT